MFITFKSDAAADVQMFADVAHQMMEIMGKSRSERGIVTVEQLPQAIARLKAAAAADKTTQARDADDAEPKYEKTPDGGKREFVSVARRAVPLIALLEYSLKAEKPVVWGV